MARPVVVFQGQNEFEAQMARDVLQAAMIPVLHLPSLSTGILGLRQTTHVAVAEDYVEEALATLQDAGFAARAMPPSQGLLPLSVSQISRVRELSWALALILLVAAAAAAVVFALRKS